MDILKGHVAVITGAGSGIGRAIATGYARDGARIVALDIDADAAAETAREIVADGGTATSRQLDVGDHKACQAPRRPWRKRWARSPFW